MSDMQKISNIIIFSVGEIVKNNNWEPFDDLVLGRQFSHSGQLEFLKNSTFKENGLHPGNGWGKTAVFARKHIFYILKHFLDEAKYKTLAVAITQDQSELVQDEILSLVHHSPLLSGWLIPPNGSIKHPNPKIRYCNGAVTEFKTTKKKGESIEGKQYGYISADEIALEPHLEFIREKILLPRMRAWTDSQIDYGATPKGYTAFYRILRTIERAGGHVCGGSSYENPHIDHKLLDYLKGIYSPTKFKQIILGEFIDTAGMMFASRVEKLFDDSLEFEEAGRGSKYIEGWDLARGRKKTADQTVGYRLKHNIASYQITKRWAFQLPWTEKERENINNELGKDKEQSSIEREIRNAYYESNAKVFLDSTGLGDTLYGIVQDIAKPVDFRGGRKDELLDNLQAVIDAGLLKAPFIPELADEMTVYQRNDKDIDTDNIMALAVACSSIKVKTRKKLEAVESSVFS